MGLVLVPRGVWPLIRIPDVPRDATSLWWERGPPRIAATLHFGIGAGCSDDPRPTAGPCAGPSRALAGPHEGNRGCVPPRGGENRAPVSAPSRPPTPWPPVTSALPRRSAACPAARCPPPASSSAGTVSGDTSGGCGGALRVLGAGCAPDTRGGGSDSSGGRCLEWYPDSRLLTVRGALRNRARFCSEVRSWEGLIPVLRGFSQMSLVPGEFGPSSTWRFAPQLVPPAWRGGFLQGPGPTRGFAPQEDSLLVPVLLESFVACQCLGPTRGGHLCSGYHVGFYSLTHGQVWHPEAFSAGPGSTQGFAPWFVLESGSRGLHLLLVLVPFLVSLRRYSPGWHADAAVTGMCPIPVPFTRWVLHSDPHSSTVGPSNLPRPQRGFPLTRTCPSARVAPTPGWTELCGPQRMPWPHTKVWSCGGRGAPLTPPPPLLSRCRQADQGGKPSGGDGRG